MTIDLDAVTIASPCKADWEAMRGDDRKRLCDQCQLNVYNLSGMTKTEAQTLLGATEGRLCVRFYRRSDGTLLTQDCPVGLQAVRRRLRLIKAAVVGVIGGWLGAVAWAKTHSDNQRPAALMGEVVVSTPTPKRVLMLGKIANPSPAKEQERVMLPKSEEKK